MHKEYHNCLEELTEVDLVDFKGKKILYNIKGICHKQGVHNWNDKAPIIFL